MYLVVWRRAISEFSIRISIKTAITLGTETELQRGENLREDAEVSAAYHFNWFDPKYVKVFHNAGNKEEVRGLKAL